MGISGIHGHCVGHGDIADPNADADTYTDADTNAYSDADTDANADTNADADTDTYTYTDSHTDKTRRRRRDGLQTGFVINGVHGIVGRDRRVIGHKQQTRKIIVHK